MLIKPHLCFLPPHTLTHIHTRTHTLAPTLTVGLACVGTALLTLDLQRLDVDFIASPFFSTCGAYQNSGLHISKKSEDSTEAEVSDAGVYSFPPLKKINGIQRQTSVAAHVLALTSCSYAWPDRTDAFRLLVKSTVSLAIFDRTARGDNENRGTQPRLFLAPVHVEKFVLQQSAANVRNRAVRNAALRVMIARRQVIYCVLLYLFFR